MTCDECQAIVIDLARGCEVDRASREEARRHAALCAGCGEQQQEQEWLTRQLRAIAASEAARHAPERVEIAAVAAWRAEYGAAAANRAPRAGATQRWRLPAVAIMGLATAAMATVFVWPSLRGGSSGGSSQQARHESAQPGASGDATHRMSGVVERLGAHAGGSRSSQSAGHSVQTPPTRPVERPAVRVERVVARTATREAEFLPLPYAEPLRSTEARHVVRVSMTSGDEMILGMLPADRRTGQPFEADVLVGEDGIARAIRVVH